jgi:hypothetical protein
MTDITIKVESYFYSFIRSHLLLKIHVSNPSIITFYEYLNRRFCDGNYFSVLLLNIEVLSFLTMIDFTCVE